MQAITTILLQKHNTVAIAGRDLYMIAIDLYILRGTDQNLCAEQPRVMSVPIGEYFVVADNYVVTNFVMNAFARIGEHAIAFIERMNIADIGPQAGTDIVVHAISAYYEIGGLHQIRAARLPA